jgi:CubicO group peptidase (beta-lactamase class C family)
LFILTNIIPATAQTLKENKDTTYENNFNSIIEELFDLQVKLLMKLGRLPSLSLCIIKNDSYIYKGYGHSNLLTRQKTTQDKVYMIASLTKTVTATALLQLYEQGLFDLDDDVNDYLDFEVRNPYYPEIPITFRMLLAHQSSLSGSKYLTYYLQLCYLKNINRYPYPMIREIIYPEGSLFINSIWNDYAPGSDSDYSSFSFILLEHLVEVISKQKFSNYCKEKIFDPLKMENTSFHLKDFNRNQLAVSYIDIGPIYIPLPFTEGLYGMGGLKSSIDDFSHYLIAHMNGGEWNGIRILNESTIKMMHTPQYPNSSDGGTKYGLGWFIWNGSDSWGFNPHGHSGRGYGMTASMEINQSYDWGIAFFVNNAMDFSKKIQTYVFFKLLELILNNIIYENSKIKYHIL